MATLRVFFLYEILEPLDVDLGLDLGHLNLVRRPQVLVLDLSNSSMKEMHISRSTCSSALIQILIGQSERKARQC